MRRGGGGALIEPEANCSGGILKLVSPKSPWSLKTAANRRAADTGGERGEERRGRERGDKKRRVEEKRKERKRREGTRRGEKRGEESRGDER